MRCCLADQILGQAARAPTLVLDHDACLVLVPRVLDQHRAAWHARYGPPGTPAVAGAMPAAQKSATVQE